MCLGDEQETVASLEVHEAPLRPEGGVQSDARDPTGVRALESPECDEVFDVLGGQPDHVPEINIQHLVGQP